MINEKAPLIEIKRLGMPKSRPNTRPSQNLESKVNSQNPDVKEVKHPTYSPVREYVTDIASPPTREEVETGLTYLIENIHALEEAYTDGTIELESLEEELGDIAPQLQRLLEHRAITMRYHDDNKKPIATYNSRNPESGLKVYEALKDANKFGHLSNEDFGTYVRELKTLGADLPRNYNQ